MRCVFRLFLLSGVIGILSLGTPNAATEPATRSSRSKTPKTSKERVEQKLSQILDNQERILKRFDEVQQELVAAKIRASR